MTAAEARWRVASAFLCAGAAVYEGRARPSSLPDMVVMDRATGATARVRVQTGKRPERGRQLIERHGGLRQALMATHPDHGGSADDFADVQAAREEGS